MLRAVQLILAGIVCCFSFLSFSMGRTPPIPPNSRAELIYRCSQYPTHPKCNRLGERRANALQFLNPEQRERIRIHKCFTISDFKSIINQSEPDFFVDKLDVVWHKLACSWYFPMCGALPLSPCNSLE